MLYHAMPCKRKKQYGRKLKRSILRKTRICGDPQKVGNIWGVGEVVVVRLYHHKRHVALRWNPSYSCGCKY